MVLSERDVYYLRVKLLSHCFGEVMKYTQCEMKFET
jgi:hypothetical protein